MKDELGRCCCYGKNILHPEVFPPLPAAFASLLDSVPDLATNARSLNNQCSFVTIGTKSAAQEKDPKLQNSWVRPSGPPQMYALRGRTYHYVAAAENRRNMFYMYLSGTDDLYSHMSSTTLKACFANIALYLRQNNLFAKEYQRVSDVCPRPEEIQLNLRTVPQNESEPFVLTAGDNDPDMAPLLTYFLYPLNGSTQMYTGMHACGESGSYPLMFPLGHGGWRVEDTSVSHYVDGSQVRTIHQ